MILEPASFIYITTRQQWVFIIDSQTFRQATSVCLFVENSDTLAIFNNCLPTQISISLAEVFKGQTST